MTRSLLKLTVTIISSGLLSFFMVTISHAASFDFSPASGNYPNNCEKELIVNVDPGSSSSNAADIEIRYDPSKIDIIDSMPGQTGIQVGTGTAYETYIYNNVDTLTGTIKVAAASFTTELTSPQEFIRIKFTAKPGVTAASFTIYFTGSGDTLDSNIADSTSNLDLLTSVTNGNYTFSSGLSCHSLTVAPAENPVSDSTTPTNIGTNVTFQATATDPNNHSYYLLLCKTGAAATPGINAPPTCNGGSSNQLCVSSVTASGVQASCSHSTVGEATIESQVWYAFICDYNTSSNCSVASQGSGASGSPYWVNHSPTLTTAPLTPSMYPGGSVTFTALSANWNDTDISPVQDTARLLVCSTSGVTSSGTCVATELCVSSSLTPGNDLSCTFDDSSEPVKLGGVYPAFVFVIDNHNFWAVGGAQGTNVTYNVNNLDPSVSNVIINKGNDITLTANTTTPIVVVATITDQNGCQDINNGVSAKLYRSSIGFSGCNSNNSSCYQIPYTNCTVDTDTGNGPLNPCSGSSDTSVRYACTVNLNYYTDPTDGVITSDPYYADNWLATVTAVDHLSGSDSFESAAGVELYSLNAMQITDTIDYGTLNPGTYSGGGSQGTINIATIITNVGNIGQDAETAGTSPGMCTSGCAAVIPVSQQKWEITNNTTPWTTGTHILSSTITPVNIIIRKPTTPTHPTIGNLYWGLAIPSSQVAGNYTGSNTVNCTVGNPANW